jgi:hypothetical protein
MKKGFLIYEEIRKYLVIHMYMKRPLVIMRKGFLIYEEMRKYLVIYEEAFSQNEEGLPKI